MTIGLTNPSHYYIKLVTEFPPRPIVNEVELMATQQRINAILDQGNLTQDDQDYLRVLGMLVYEYEEKHEPIPALTDGEVLQILMDEYQLQIKDFLKIFATEAIIFEILQGKRQMNTQEAFKVRSLFP